MHDSDQFQVKEKAVNLTVWIPVTFGLGLGTFALMALFVEACDRV